jgi:hypothetical protein
MAAALKSRRYVLPTLEVTKNRQYSLQRIISPAADPIAWKKQSRMLSVVSKGARPISDIPDFGDLASHHPRPRRGESFCVCRVEFGVFWRIVAAEAHLPPA